MARKKSDDRSSRGFHSRRVGSRPLPYSFLIVCEGSKTEPEYFEAFPLARGKASIETSRGGGAPGQVVTKAVQRAKQAKSEGTPFDQVWCVFDRDDVDEDDFNRALQEANKRGFRVAYTNQAFELWYLLHYDYHNTGIDRRTYQDRLTEKLGYTYRKNDPGMYATLVARQQTAIRFAEKLLNEYDPCNPANDNPSTTVHWLVQELNAFIRSR
jgi:hypothetical protein